MIQNGKSNMGEIGDEREQNEETQVVRREKSENTLEQSDTNQIS
jgi:hypothetical protein